LRYTGDIVRDVEPAPASKKAIRRKQREIAGASAIFQNPIIEGLAPQLLNLFSRNLTVSIPELKAREEPLSEEEEGQCLLINVCIS
jgi:hypothetical protein